MQPDNGLTKVIPKWLTNRFNSSSNRPKRSFPLQLYNTKHSDEAFYGVYFENSSIKSMETFVYSPLEKLFGMNIQTNTFKRTKKKLNLTESEHFTSLVRVTLSLQNQGSHFIFSVLLRRSPVLQHIQ